MRLSILAFVLTLILYLFLPFILILWFLFYLKMLCIKLIAKFIHGTSDILNSNSQVELEYRNTVILIETEVDGRVEVNSLIQKFNNRILPFKSNHYFCNRVVYILGYPFWIGNTNFKTNEHIRYYPESVIEIHDIKRITEEIKKFEFDPSVRSPWELIITHVKRKDDSIYSIGFIRFHHILGDGFTAFELLSKFFDQEVELKQPKTTSTLNVENCLALPWILLKSPYDAIKLGLQTSQQFPSKLKKERIEAYGECVDISDLKEIATDVGSSVTSVIIGGIVIALKESQRMNEVNLMKVESICMYMPLRIPNRKPTDDQNPISPIAVIFIPTENTTNTTIDSVKLIQTCNNVLLSAVGKGFNSTYFLKFLTNISNGFRFHTFGENVASRGFILSNFPGPLKEVTTDGYRIKDIGYGFQVVGMLPPVLTVLSYAGKLSFRINADASVISNEENARKFLKNITMSVEFFKKEMKVDEIKVIG